ncbi:hypothetical protein J6590_002178 [Homalodisca vitripennis]|nr:hypothetical protein J6590_002178 [Homalodisca vitripennis]
MGPFFGEKLNNSQVCLTFISDVKQAVQVPSVPICSPKMGLIRDHIEDLLVQASLDLQLLLTPPLIVPKKRGSSSLVVDFRALNNVLELDSITMPILESPFQFVGKA